LPYVATCIFVAAPLWVSWGHDHENALGPDRVDAADLGAITSMSADLRGNTDESWSRAMSYLLRNRLLAPNYGAPQPR